VVESVTVDLCAELKSRTECALNSPNPLNSITSIKIQAYALDARIDPVDGSVCIAHKMKWDKTARPDCGVSWSEFDTDSLEVLLLMVRSLGDRYIAEADVYDGRELTAIILASSIAVVGAYERVGLVVDNQWSTWDIWKAQNLEGATLKEVLLV